MRAIVEKAVIRLEAKLEVHQAHENLEAAEAADRLSFDPSAWSASPASSASGAWPICPSTGSSACPA